MMISLQDEVSEVFQKVWISDSVTRTCDEFSI